MRRFKWFESQVGRYATPGSAGDCLDNEKFVRLVYSGVLRREADNDGLEYYTSLLNKSKITYNGVIAALIESDEFVYHGDYSIENDPQYSRFLTKKILDASHMLASHSPFKVDELDRAVPGLVGLEYYEFHKKRFQEMVNGLDLLEKRHGYPLIILECGSIFSTKIIKTIFPTINISTLDVLDVEEMGIENVYTLKDIVNKHYRVDLVRDGLDDMLLEQEPKFDVILLCEVIEHLLVNPHRIIRFLLRQLKSGGYIYLTTPNVFKRGNINAIARRINPFILYPENYTFDDAFMFHVREYCMGELLNIAHSAGGLISAFYFSSCWDDPTLAKSTPSHELGNLVVLIQKP